MRQLPVAPLPLGEIGWLQPPGQGLQGNRHLVRHVGSTLFAMTPPLPLQQRSKALEQVLALQWPVPDARPLSFLQHTQPRTKPASKVVTRASGRVEGLKLGALHLPGSAPDHHLTCVPCGARHTGPKMAADYYTPLPHYQYCQLHISCALKTKGWN